MKVVELFEEDSEQVLRLPKEYHFEDNRVQIKKVGDAVILLPVKNAWQPLLNSLSMFSDDFMIEQRETL